jgi:hypothetical protein
MRTTFAAIAFGFAAMNACAGDHGIAKQSSISPELQKVISQIGDASQRKDFNALRSAMVQNFVWSFGGDSDADQAIAEWKKNPQYLRDLALASRAKCGAEGSEYIQCPANAGTRFRAGFRLVGGQWKMAYFVGGD